MGITERINRGLDLVGAEWVMWLLVVLSILSLACIMERWLFLMKRRVDLDEAWKSISARMDANSTERNDSGACQSMEEVAAQSVLAEGGRSPEALEDVALAAIESEKLKYNRRLSFLATTASNAPFIGLLGTVVGIVEAFAKLTEVAPGQSRSSLIMGSLSEALAATAIGLLVAIPAAAAYNWLQGRVDDCVSRSEILTRRIIARLR
jgi:biopolymer transport protein ExbB